MSRIEVIGIMIAEDDNKYQLFSIAEKINDNTFSVSDSARSKAEGLPNILEYLSVGIDTASQFIIVYNVSCQDKERRIKDFLELHCVKNTVSMPILISTGKESSESIKEITGKFSKIIVVENSRSSGGSFEDIIQMEQNRIKNEWITSLKLKAEDRLKTESSHEITSYSLAFKICSGIGGALLIVGTLAILGFVAAIAPVAGVFMLVPGAASVFAGISLFSCAFSKKDDENSYQTNFCFDTSFK